MNRVKMFAALMMLMLGCWLTGVAAADDKKEDKDGGDKAFAKKSVGGRVGGGERQRIGVEPSTKSQRQTLRTADGYQSQKGQR